MTLSDELTWRGLTHQTTFADISDIDRPRTFYLGVDPSAKSMHIGNLAQVIVAKHLINHGYKAIVLVGGATGMIGDPKEDAERDLKSLEAITENKTAIAQQYRQLLQGEEFEVVDNYDWFKEIGYLNFLRDIGKHFSMTQLLDRDFIKARIGEGGVGISYAEFSYSLIQGYDFLHLFREKGATLQIGGSDQWGNMLSGAQMIKKMTDGRADVWTVPLILDKTTGKKFGKSEGNAVWLDAQMTSPYAFYQFWLNVDDNGVIDYLKTFTFFDESTVESLAKTQTENPGARHAQKALAYEVTKFVHGEDRANQAKRVTEVLFESGDTQQLTDEEITMLSHEIPCVSAETVIEALVLSKLAPSNGEARRLIEGNAISINGQKIASDQSVTARDLIKKGKNSFTLVQ